jgi:FKBP-type peptidyl-prolyl cis-trans isomerase FkpA
MYPQRMHRLIVFHVTRVLVVLVLALTVAACGGDDDSTPTGPSTPRGEYSQTDLVVGTGTEATNGRLVSVNYTGWLYNPTGADGKGTQFDSSLLPGRTPLSWTLGSNQVISGFNRGTLGMRVGGRRRVVIPPELAYGASGNGPIGPNATLVFEIELLNVQ